MSNIIRAAPAIRLIIWFIIPIIIGAILLSLPVSNEQGMSVSFIDALFTATSAFCVTGLTVVNVPDSFSYFGEVVIMVLMQLGGLGVMAFSTLFFLVFGARISTGQTFDLKSTFTSRGDVRVRSILKSAFLVTMIIEGIGVVVLFFAFVTKLDPLKALYFAIFHSVSAFNNAGLSISPGNLRDWHGNIPVLLGVASLIVIGGLGFTANAEIYQKITNRPGRRRTSLHTKLVITTTAILLIGGTACFILLEMNNAYKSDTWPTKIISGVFQAVTPRTAGFDSVDQNQLSVLSILLTIALMMIGASPGSTGGGIKTTSFAIIIMAVVARVKGSNGVDAFRRTVSYESVIKAVSIFILASFLVFVASALLMLSEHGFRPAGIERGTELAYFFETVSAFGTVGLSLGITPFLHSPGKLILVLVMIIGRVGLLTLFYVVARPEGADRISYSEENVMIG
jgi:trk system potassium uptake protein TrkH